jgi:hypothetical protein
MHQSVGHHDVEFSLLVCRENASMTMRKGYNGIRGEGAALEDHRDITFIIALAAALSSCRKATHLAVASSPR